MLRAIIENEVAKEVICMTHGYERRRGSPRGSWGCWVKRGKGGKIGTTVIA